MSPEIHRLLDALTKLAAQFLQDEETFPPSGATLGADDQVSLVKPFDREGYEAPEMQVGLLQASFRQAAGKGEIRACAFCLDVQVQDPNTDQETEAILVSIETEAGEAMDIFVPYTRTPELELGRPFAGEREARVFATGEPS